ncbi:MAG: PAS domain-containing protein [Pseudomonadota bacterium]
MLDRIVTGREIVLKPTDTIQSRTDTRGKIMFANPTMMRIAGYEKDELIGAPHSILRHPDMPRSVFYVMWDMIQRGEEFYGFVKNRAKSGDHYWVFTRVGARKETDGSISGYSSVRIAPKRQFLPEWEDVYAHIRAVEAKFPRDEQCAEGAKVIMAYLAKRGYNNLTDYVIKQT